MRKLCLHLTLLVCAAISVAAQPAYQVLRYNEDWSFLADSSKHTDWLDPVKFIPLSSTNFYVSFGGDARLKYERYDQPVFNQKPADNDGFLLQRYLLHADVHATPYFRGFVQLQSSLEDFRTGGPRPTDLDRLDFHQAFFDANVFPGDTSEITLRAGRQELAYGSQRLITVREGPNNRLAFDAVRVLTTFGDWHADVWLGQPVEIDQGTFDDQRIDTTTFWGGYVTGPLPFIQGLRADFYYLGLARENAHYASGTADEVRHALGTRLFGTRGALDWNFEFVGQFGTFGNRDILAWTAASDTGWTFAKALTKPRLFLRADIASGDHGGSNLGTFNPLFPRGVYFNEAGLIGPQNLIDLQPGIDFTLTKTLKLTTSCDFVWRQALEDGVYGVSGNLQVAPGKSDASFVGTFPSVTLAWQATRHLSFNVNYVAYLFGDFVTQSQPNQRNGNYVNVIAQFKF